MGQLEVRPVVDYLVQQSTERGFFGRYKHQTSDYGFWGNIVNLKFDQLMTEIQVRTYGMFYAAQPEDVARSVLGDSIYTVIHTKTGLEPGLAHYYYEVMRADTSSEATREEAEAYIRCRNRQHPSDELYEHWYVAIRH